MKQAFSSLMLVMLCAGMLTLAVKIQPVKAPNPQVYYSVEPVATPPLYDANSSVNGLETPGTPEPILQNFTVEIHLRNATITNVPVGVAGVEVHFYFGNILRYCRPLAFVDMLGQPGGVLPPPPNPIVYSKVGFYDDADNLIATPPYTAATQYIVQAASISGFWNNDDGLITVITFQIIYQPQGYLGEPDFYAPLQIDFADLIDSNGTIVAFSTVQGTLNIDKKPFLTPPYPDVGVRTVVPSRTALSQAYVSSINVTVTVFTGVDPETFNLTSYANAIPIGSQDIIMDGATVSNINFTWNVLGLAYGNYTMSAYAEPVPNETNTMNNNCTDGVIAITIPGDVNGDFNVSLVDLVILANAYGSKPGDAKWNCNADIDNNGVVGLTDLVIMAIHYGQHYP